MTRLGFIAALAFALQAAPSEAETLALPGNAELVAEDTLRGAALPVAAFDGTRVALEEVGALVQRQVWQVPAAGVESHQLIALVAEQAEEAGYDIVLRCAGAACGGFDFRMHLPLAAPPQMHVDLGDFAYLLARKDAALIAAVASRSSELGFLQLMQALPDGSGLQVAASDPRLGAGAVPTGALGAALEGVGRVVLDGLAFETGSAELGSGPFPALAALADYLIANPNRRIALVGHTDAEGSLEGNIALSKRRAGSVLERLASDYGVPRQQMEAEGMGYLAPIAPNTSAEGREANRRVEAILTSTD